MEVLFQHLPWVARSRLPKEQEFRKQLTVMVAWALNLADLPEIQQGRMVRYWGVSSASEASSKLEWSLEWVIAVKLEVFEDGF
jgi:hypothetical protein